MNIIQIIEADLEAAWHEVEADAEKFGAILWDDIKAVALALKPAVYADLRIVILGMLKAFEGGDLADIEQALLMVLETGKTALFAEAQALGSNMLQLIIAQVRAAL